VTCFIFSVAEGIKHFKDGNQVEAMQLLNKALQIDEVNVEALTARGAL
jgi:Flp pilus assembly protein TadD